MLEKTIWRDFCFDSIEFWNTDRNFNASFLVTNTIITSWLLFSINISKKSKGKAKGKSKTIMKYVSKKNENLWISICHVTYQTSRSYGQIKKIALQISYRMYLTLSWRRPLSFASQINGLYDSGLHHERVNSCIYYLSIGSLSKDSSSNKIILARLGSLFYNNSWLNVFYSAKKLKASNSKK